MERIVVTYTTSCSIQTKVRFLAGIATRDKIGKTALLHQRLVPTQGRDSFRQRKSLRRLNCTGGVSSTGPCVSCSRLAGGRAGPLGVIPDAQ